MLDILWDALLDTLKLLPFLFLTYTAMEYLEHRWQGGGLLQKAGRLGPLWGDCWAWFRSADSRRLRRGCTPGGWSRWGP